MENKKRNFAIITARYCIWLVVLGMFCAAGARAQGGAPRYKIDPYWPKPLPHHWVLGSIGGVCIDHQNHIFVLNRSNYTNNQLTAGEKAPPVLEFDSAGNLIDSWGNLATMPGVAADPRAVNPSFVRNGNPFHGCAIDKQDHLWLISAYGGALQEYTEKGKLLRQIGKLGVVDSSTGTLAGKALNSGPSLFGPQGIAVDPKSDNIYVAEGIAPWGNHRVVVFNQKGHLVRQWKIPRTPGDPALDWPGHPTKWEPVVHCINIDMDNNVYVCDRSGDKILVFNTMGHLERYVRIPLVKRTEFTPARPTQMDGYISKAWGTVIGLFFSTDPEQKYLININEDDEEVTFLNRKTLKVVTSFGRVGTWPGEFMHAHFGQMDSKGNIYIGEVGGERVDKFVPVNHNW